MKKSQKSLKKRNGFSFWIWSTSILIRSVKLKDYFPFCFLLVGDYSKLRGAVPQLEKHPYLHWTFDLVIQRLRAKGIWPALMHNELSPFPLHRLGLIWLDDRNNQGWKSNHFMLGSWWWIYVPRLFFKLCFHRHDWLCHLAKSPLWSRPHNLDMTQQPWHLVTALARLQRPSS